MNANTHLLVDGSNLIHAWPDTRALVRQNRDAARALLVKRIAPLHEGAGWRVTIVFDGRGDALQVDPVAGAADFACIYTPAGTTADDIIEQLVARAAAPELCLVSTADQAERGTVEAAGAAWCSPGELAARIEAQDTRRNMKLAAMAAQTDRKWHAR
jgi:uncharacterized protein